MRECIGEILAQYGQTITLQMPEGDVVTRAFLQPLREKQEQPIGCMTELGWVDQRLWMYLGQADVVPGDRMIWNETVFRVRSSRPYQIGDTQLYCWAVLEQDKEAAE